MYSSANQDAAYSCHWKNGVKYDNNAPGNNEAWAMLVKPNGDVVTSGAANLHHDNTPVYWINNNRHVVSLPNATEPAATLWDVAMHPETNALRFCGDYSTADTMSDIAVHFKPGMVKNNKGSWEATWAEGLTVGQGGAVYTAGYVDKMVYGEWNGNVPDLEIIKKPAYWVNNRLNVLPGASVNGVMLNEGTARDIELVDGKIVVVGFLNGMNYDTNNDGIPDDWDGDGNPDKNHDTGYPCIWIDGTPHVLDSQNIGEVYTLHVR